MANRLVVKLIPITSLKKAKKCKCGHEFAAHDYSMALDPFYRGYKDCRECGCKKFAMKSHNQERGEK